MNTSINTNNTVTKLYTIPETTEVKDNVIQFPLSNYNTTKKTKDTQSKTRKQSKTVQPMKDKQDIERAKEYFLNSHTRYTGINLRNYCLFVLGINCARRISDILNLKISDVIDSKGRFAEDGWIYITEQKTGKPATFQLHPYVQEAIKQYLDTRPNINSEEYLFKSRKPSTKTKDGEYVIDPKTAWDIMNKMSQELELNYNVGTHTMRKTKVYQTIKSNKDDPYIVAAMSQELNHSSIGMTYRYCGFDKEVRSHLYMDNPL